MFQNFQSKNFSFAAEDKPENKPDSVEPKETKSPENGEKPVENNEINKEDKPTETVNAESKERVTPPAPEEKMET